MPKLYVMVALPRSGKSTYVQEHFRHIVKISADQLRLLIYGKRFWFQGEKKVWAIREIMLKAIMEQGLDIVIDETNTTKSSRLPILKLAKQYHYTVTAVVVKTDKEICKERAIKTGQQDLIPVIEKMEANYEEVSKEEGFDEIIDVKGSEALPTYTFQT